MSLRGRKYQMINTVDGVDECMKAATSTSKKIVKAGYSYHENTHSTKEGFPYLLIKNTMTLINDFTFAMIILAACNYALCKDKQQAEPLIKGALRPNGFLHDLVSTKEKKGLFGKTKYVVNSAHLKTHFDPDHGSFNSILDIVFSDLDFKNLFGSYINYTSLRQKLIKKLQTKAGRMTNWIMNGPDTFAVIWGILEKADIKLNNGNINSPKQVETGIGIALRTDRKNNSEKSAWDDLYDDKSEIVSGSEKGQPLSDDGGSSTGFTEAEHSTESTPVHDDKSEIVSDSEKGQPKSEEAAYKKFMQVDSAEEFMKVFCDVFNDKNITSMEDLMACSKALLRAISDQSKKHDADPYNALIRLKGVDRELKYVHGKFSVSAYVRMFKVNVERYIEDIFQASEDDAGGEEKATVTPIDEKTRNEVLKKYYGKTVEPGEELVLYFKGKRRIWIPINDSFPKTNTEHLDPLTEKEKLQLALEGAKGRERKAIVDFLDKEPKKGYTTDVERIEDFMKIDAEKRKDVLEFIECNYIFSGRPKVNSKAPTEMDAGTHGIAHATRAVGYVNNIARFIKKHHKMLKLKSPTKDEIILAKYAALFHDSGRANTNVDVFDETSSHIAGEELKGKLSSENIERVQDAIKNKDASVDGKDIVAVMLHEVDTFDVIRVYGVKGFNIKYLDVVQSYFGKKPDEISDKDVEALPKEIADDLEDLKIYCVRYINKLDCIKKSDILDDED